LTENAETLTAQALLNCLVREVCGPGALDGPGAPGGLVRAEPGHVLIRLPATGVLVRAAVRRPSAGLGPRLSGEAAEHRDGRWARADWRRLADLIARELTLETGVVNPEFAAQVGDSRASMTAIRRARDDARTRDGSWTGRYLASEQALLAGHRFHPAPKARSGDPADWLPYAPEAGARFRLRFLAVRDRVLAGDGDAGALARLGGPPPDLPGGYRLLPAHPWQFRIQAADPSGWLRRALDTGLALDLGEGNREVVATSSVRTVYDPVADVFGKFSLGARITNCVRTSAWYELAGSVELSGLLRPVLSELAARHAGGTLPGTAVPAVAVLAEPAYRTVAASTRGAYEGLAVIVREGLRPHLRPGVTPLLAGALTEPGFPAPPAAARDPEEWWDAYLRVLVPPVLDLLVTHGVALEPHLQNVLVGVDEQGWPAQVIFRDLEGTKLVRGEHAARLEALPRGIADRLAYDPDRAWNRVLYCLLVNHLAEIAAALADRQLPDRERAGALEARLWAGLRDVLAKCGADLGWPPRLRAVLDGGALPAKANLRVRWARAADREAEYVPVPSPFGRGQC
jgi:siderophore synthetase component